MVFIKRKIFTLIFGIQCLVLVLQITSVSSIPQVTNEPQIRPARRRPESSLLYGNQIYGAARLQKRPSRRRTNNSPTSHPNSYYSRLITNNVKPSRTDRLEKHKDERDKTLHHHHHGGGLFGDSHHGNNHGLSSIHNFHHNSNRRRQQNPCYYRRRNYYRSNSREQEGRFLWDLNLYNIHGGGHSAQYDDCNDSGGSGLFSDNGPIRRPQNYLELLANYGQGIRPGGSRPYRPSGGRPTSGGVGGGVGGGGGGGLIGGTSDNDIGDSDVYDPVYDDRDRPVYESQLDANAGPPLSAGQLVGGVAHTVNGIIQTLAGNSYGSGGYRRRYSY